MANDQFDNARADKAILDRLIADGLPPGEHADDGDEVIPADLDGMGACEVCGGSGWARIGVYRDSPNQSGVIPCPPPPDGCGGTGRRARK